MPGDEALAGHFLVFAEAGFNFVAESQAFERGVKQAPVERVLVAVPQAGGRAAGVAEGVDEEVAQPVGVADQLGKGS